MKARAESWPVRENVLNCLHRVLDEMPPGTKITQASVFKAAADKVAAITKTTAKNKAQAAKNAYVRVVNALESWLSKAGLQQLCNKEENGTWDYDAINKAILDPARGGSFSVNENFAHRSALALANKLAQRFDTARNSTNSKAKDEKKDAKKRVITSALASSDVDGGGRLTVEGASDEDDINGTGSERKKSRRNNQAALARLQEMEDAETDRHKAKMKLEADRLEWEKSEAESNRQLERERLAVERQRLDNAHIVQMRQVELQAEFQSMMMKLLAEKMNK